MWKQQLKGVSPNKYFFEDLLFCTGCTAVRLRIGLCAPLSLGPIIFNSWQYPFERLVTMTQYTWFPLAYSNMFRYYLNISHARDEDTT